jgi:FMN phosphatase YigB (HAD superfamily)
MEIKLKSTGLGKYFSEQISAVSDIGFVKTDPQAYEKLVEKLGIQKENLVHVGDYVHHDYEPARSVGVKSILIDRDGAFDDTYDKILTLGDVEKFL